MLAPRFINPPFWSLDFCDSAFLVDNPYIKIANLDRTPPASLKPAAQLAGFYGFNGFFTEKRNDDARPDSIQRIKFQGYFQVLPHLICAGLHLNSGIISYARNCRSVCRARIPLTQSVFTARKQRVIEHYHALSAACRMFRRL